jgi:hypothetical protein
VLSISPAQMPHGDARKAHIARGHGRRSSHESFHGVQGRGPRIVTQCSREPLACCASCGRSVRGGCPADRLRTRPARRPVPWRATGHQVLLRNGLVAAQEQEHKRGYRRWQREAPMHLRQLRLVGGACWLMAGRPSWSLASMTIPGSW